MRREIIPYIVMLAAMVAVIGAIRERRQARTRLAVVVVVDQLRADLLDRYDDLFEGGFRRLRDRGYRFTTATQDHWWTETAAGHTAIATGAYPSHNGIVRNSFTIPDGDAFRSIYSFDDPASPITGAPDLPGRSPLNMLRPAFAEWLVGHDPESRIATISRKDRGAIPLAGRTPATVLWMDIESARFVTSSWYATQNPAWLDDFNDRVMPQLYSDSAWTLQVPGSALSLARRDSADYENGGRDVTFPHEASERSRNQSYNGWIAETPVPDQATLMLARRMVEELELGRRDHVDMLGISLSQTDAIGHNWGPLSLEQFDNLLRLDRQLGQFMQFLDEYVGEDRWVLALSADHGIMTAPEYLAELDTAASRMTRDQQRAQAALLTELAQASDPATRNAAMSALEALPFVADVVTLDELRGTAMPADSFVTLMRNSYVADRGTRALMAPPEAIIRQAEHMIATSSDASTHGSPYFYDRHVPLIFMGPGIASGASDGRAATVDLAPTLAELLGIPLPQGVDGLSRAGQIRR